MLILTFSVGFLPEHHTQVTVVLLEQSEWDGQQSWPRNWEDGRDRFASYAVDALSLKMSVVPWGVSCMFLLNITEINVSMTHAGILVPEESVTSLLAESEHGPACYLELLGSHVHPIFQPERWAVPQSSIRNASKPTKTCFVFPLCCWDNRFCNSTFPSMKV